MKRLVSLFLLLSIAIVAFSQDLGTFHKVELGINGLAVSLEIPVASSITVEPAIGVGPSYDLRGDDDYSLTEKMDWHWALLEPSIHASVYGKWFYNRSKRESKGKSTWLNSGHYIGVKVKYVSKSLSDPQFYSNTLLTNLNWGGQHNLGRHWTLGYSAGVGYGRNLDYSYGLFYPAFDLKVGYVLPFFSK